MNSLSLEYSSLANTTTTTNMKFDSPSQYYEPLDQLAVVNYDNMNTQHCSSTSSSSSSPTSTNSSNSSNYYDTCRKPPAPADRSTSNAITTTKTTNNRLFYNFNHATSSLSQNYYNSLVSTPILKPSMHHHNQQLIQPSEVEFHPHKKVSRSSSRKLSSNPAPPLLPPPLLTPHQQQPVIKILKNTASLLSESVVNSVNVCGSASNSIKRVESSYYTTNTGQVSPLKHKDSLMKRIFTRAKSKDKHPQSELGKTCDLSRKTGKTC